jgi:leucyl aminopeptidase
VKLNFAKPEMPKTGAVVVGTLDGRKLSPGATMIDRAAGGAITRAIEASRFKGGAEDALTVLAPNGLQASRVLLLGLGKPEKFDRQAAERVGGRIVVQLQNSGESEASVLVDAIAGAEITAAEMAALIARERVCAPGASTSTARKKKLTTTQPQEAEPARLRSCRGETSLPAAGQGGRWRSLHARAVSEPANVIYPETLAAEAHASAISASRSRPWCEGDAQARDGRALGRRPGQRARASIGGHAVERRRAREGQKAAGIYRQGVTFDTAAFPSNPLPAWKR